MLTLDDDAGGYGWFIDQTPDNASEFSAGSAAHLLTADPNGAAAGHVDLLSVIAHELGHGLTLIDYPRVMATRLMSQAIGLGERRLPSSLDLANLAPTVVQGSTPQSTPTVQLAPQSTFVTSSLAYPRPARRDRCERAAD